MCLCPLVFMIAELDFMNFQEQRMYTFIIFCDVSEYMPYAAENVGNVEVVDCL